MGFQSIEGGITAPSGISACGIAAGLRSEPGRLDMALIVPNEPCVAAGVFTQNRFCAAPVTVSRENLKSGRCAAVIINSGTANAATGEEGLRLAHETTDIVAEGLGCKPEEVLVASTGVIGVQLDISKFQAAVPRAIDALSETGGPDAARAIMTTDRVAKEYAVSFEIGSHTYRMGGMVKGAGMIMPDMATMIAIITTDAPLDGQAAQSMLSDAAKRSFNKVTVDSDTSTNDTCMLLATGKAGGEVIGVDSEGYEVVSEACRIVCIELAKKIARDGEGSSRMIEVTVRGASSDEDADVCARAIANSPLVKTAVAGHDCNWGRIAAAAGKSGAVFSQENVDIDIMGMPVLRRGLPVAFDEDEALVRFEQPEISIDVDLGEEGHATTIWTCDLTHGYIEINAGYRS